MEGRREGGREGEKGWHNVAFLPANLLLPHWHHHTPPHTTTHTHTVTLCLKAAFVIRAHILQPPGKLGVHYLGSDNCWRGGGRGPGWNSNLSQDDFWRSVPVQRSANKLYWDYKRRTDQTEVGVGGGGWCNEERKGGENQSESDTVNPILS